MKFKKGDRVYFKYSEESERYNGSAEGVGVIEYDFNDGDYNVTGDDGTDYLVETLDANDTLLPESVHKSKLFKALK